jgi:hypothetical protein
MARRTRRTPIALAPWRAGQQGLLTGAATGVEHAPGQQALLREAHEGGCGRPLSHAAGVLAAYESSQLGVVMVFPKYRTSPSREIAAALAPLGWTPRAVRAAGRGVVAELPRALLAMLRTLARAGADIPG